MAPVHGKPFVEWVVRYLAKQGIRSIVLSTGHLSETLERHFQSQPVPGVTVRCVPEMTPLGTAGGFLNAVSGAPKPSPAWLVVNGDSLVLAPLEPVIASLNEPEVSGAIVGVPMSDASRYGTVEQDVAGDLISFREKRSGAGVINAGIYLFRSSALEGFRRGVPLSFEKEVFPELIARKVRMKVCAVNASFLDIGTPESLPQATAFVAEHLECFVV